MKKRFKPTDWDKHLGLDPTDDDGLIDFIPIEEPIYDPLDNPKDHPKLIPEVKYGGKHEGSE